MQRLRQRSGISAELLDDRLILIDLASGDYHVLNSTGAVIWDLCDGTHSATEIAQAVADLYSIEQSRAEADVVQLLCNLRAAGLLDDGTAGA